MIVYCDRTCSNCGHCKTYITVEEFEHRDILCPECGNKWIEDLNFISKELNKNYEESVQNHTKLWELKEIINQKKRIINYLITIIIAVGLIITIILLRVF